MLENVKVGDKLYVSMPYNAYSIEIVERVTNTLVITKQHRFIKKSGRAQGCDKWTSTVARPATSEQVLQVAIVQKHSKLVSQCQYIEFDELCNEQLEKILEIAKQTNND